MTDYETYAMREQALLKCPKALQVRLIAHIIYMIDVMICQGRAMAIPVLNPFKHFLTAGVYSIILSDRERLYSIAKDPGYSPNNRNHFCLVPLIHCQYIHPERSITNKCREFFLDEPCFLCRRKDFILDARDAEPFCLPKDVRDSNILKLAGVSTEKDELTAYETCKFDFWSLLRI